MDGYLEKLDSWMANVEREARREPSPHRSKILWNFLHHGAMEVSGKWEGIFAPEMTVAEPRYKMHAGSEEPVFLDGAEEVKAHYASRENDVNLLIDNGNHQAFVNDEGIADFSTYIEFMRGRTILDDGLEKNYYGEGEVDDPDAMYRLTALNSMFWPYNEDAQLLGEHVYQLEPFSITKVDPDEVPTLDEIAATVESYLPENTAGPTPVTTGEYS